MLAIFQSFGLPELGIILLIALIIFGPAQLPKIGRSMGKALREFREGSTELTKAIREGVDSSEKEESKKKEEKKEEKKDDEE
jgi:sec-independent protein translocase protein TatA